MLSYSKNYIFEKRRCHTKTFIYYFTATGNSLYASRKLNKCIKNSFLFSIVKALKEDELSIDADVVGIVFPMYYGGLPEMVERFIKKVNMKKDTYVFAVATRGATSGHAMIQINDLLKSKSLILHKGFFLTMPANYVRMYDMKSDEKVDKVIKEADKKIEVISKTVRNKEISFIEKPLTSYVTYKLYKGFLKKLKNADNKFIVDNNCNGCKICTQVCPENNIKMENERPKWQHHCQDCMACIQLCPQKSIQIGNKTLKRGRYRNPYITIEDIINQNK